MGYYINQTSKGDPFPNRGKLEALQAAGDVEQVLPSAPVELVPNLVCFILGGGFDAAGYVYDHRALKEFAHPSDTRPKRWAIVSKAKQLSGFAQ